MSLSTQTFRRLPHIKQGLIHGETYEQIAVTCKVHHRTIERDVQSWVGSGLFEVWLKTEFVRLHGLKCKEGDVDKAYDNVTKLVGKMITRRMEVKKEIKTEHKTDIHILMEKYEQVIERAANRDIQRNDIGQ